MRFLLFLCILFGVFAACSPIRHLQPTQSLLYSQEIVGSKAVAADFLIPFYRQKINRRLFSTQTMPYLEFYKMGEKKLEKNKAKYMEELAKINEKLLILDTDSTLKMNKSKIKEREKLDGKKTKLETLLKDGNWLMRSVGEPPVIFDVNLMKETAEKMQIYLNQQGFFSAKVKPIYKIDRQKASVIYEVYEGIAHHIYRFETRSEDTVLLKIIQQDSLNSVVKRQDRYNEGKLATERDRLTRMLKDYGYYFFSKENIYFEVDTFNLPKEKDRKLLNVSMFIELTKGKFHKQYTLGDVNITTDAQNRDSENLNKKRDTTLYENVKFISYQKRYSKKILDNKIIIRPRQLYNQSFSEETQRSLANMNIYKFVNVKYDTIKGRLVANIFANPMPSSDISIEGGVTMSQSLPGPYGSLSWKQRNLLRISDLLDFNARGSIEAQVSAFGNANTQSYQALEWHFNGTLTLPFLLFPLSKKMQNRLSLSKIRTKIGAGTVYIQRPEYTRFTLQSSFGYDWTNHKQSNFSVGLLNLMLVNTPSINQRFQSYLVDLYFSGNKTLLQSFNRSIVTNTSLAYTYHQTINKNDVFLQINAEAGGTYLTLLNMLDNGFLNRNSTLNGLNYYRYVRLQAEGRYYIATSKDSKLALRAMIGIAKSIGKNPDGTESSLPYEKFFFSGGSNSIRAWRPRRLGPGTSAIIGDDGQPDYRFEQPGEMIIEANVEYRTKLFGFVHGALFVDAGNVWMLRDDGRYGSQFDMQTFLGQFAVGAGFGLRFDFSLLIMRFDLATKVFDPVRPEGQRFVLSRTSFSDFIQLKQSVFNIGIGYPF